MKWCLLLGRGLVARRAELAMPNLGLTSRDGSLQGLHASGNVTNGQTVTSNYAVYSQR
jgi:hypothetical protein